MKFNRDLNCDYQIYYGSRIIYVELAGMIQHTYEINYEQNIPIKDKIMEEYRQKLNIKRELMEKYNCDYYIILPTQMNGYTYRNILNISNKKEVV
jgi:hypothetical protein